MSEFCIGVVVGIALAAAAVFVAIRIVARSVDVGMAQAARTVFGREPPE